MAQERRLTHGVITGIQTWNSPAILKDGHSQCVFLVRGSSVLFFFTFSFSKAKGLQVRHGEVDRFPQVLCHWPVEG